MKKLFAFVFIFILRVQAYSQIPSYVPKDFLAGWWSFTGNAIDSSGNGNNGTVNGAIPTTDRNNTPNTSYEFTNGYISCNTLGIPTDNTITIGYWFNEYSSYGIAEMICLGSAANTRWGCVGSNNGFCLNYGRGCGSTGSSRKNIPLTFNVWHHVVYVSDGVNNSTKIYFDGNFIDTSKNANTSGTCSNDSLYIGVDIFSSPFYFNGKIDDIGIWNRALNQCEITKLYLSMPSLITKHPINDTLTSLTSATFTITDTMGTSATYQWQENSGSGFVNLTNVSPYSGVTTKTLTINPVKSPMNNYQYRCIRNGGTCIDTSDAAKLVINTTGISNVTKDLFAVYPNPTNGTVTIANNSKITKVEITNVIGQKLLSEQYNSNKVIVDISSFERGIYFIRVNNSYIEKLVKE